MRNLSLFETSVKQFYTAKYRQCLIWSEYKKSLYMSKDLEFESEMNTIYKEYDSSLQDLKNRISNTGVSIISYSGNPYSLVYLLPYK